MIRSRLRSRTFRGNVTPPFTPLSISGCQLWLDASDTSSITHTSNSVSQWNDKSGNARHATQGTAVNQPVTNTRTVNSLNVIDYPPSPFRQLDLGTGINSVWLGANTVFLVTNTDNTSLDRGYFECSGTPQGQGIVVSNNTVRKARFRHGNSSLADVSGTLNTNPMILARTYNGASSVTGYIDGGTGVSQTAAAVTATSNTLMGSSFGTDGLYAEVIVYNSALSTTDMNRVGQYLATKWGITWTNI